MELFEMQQKINKIIDEFPSIPIKGDTKLKLCYIICKHPEQKGRTIMKNEIKYELPIFSSTLEQDPVIESKDIIAQGYEVIEHE